MCLVVFAWNAVNGRRLVLVGNRDEFHARPAAPMQWWASPPLLGGRDLLGGGTWLGIGTGGRFGVVTNLRGGPSPPAAPSRGTLIPRFLASGDRPARFLAALAGEAGRYAGFSLLLGDDRELACLSNDGGGVQLLGPGIYGLSNGPLDAPWPKVLKSRARLAARLRQPLGETHELLELLADRAPAADAQLPDTGIGLERERRLSPAFIVSDGYGTRAATALVIDADGSGSVVERSHGPDGAATGSRHFRLAGDGP